ncbi:relaxase/mobilization nuclease domain-containing protein [uncultured Pontibacter sp.]|uniref:relaxase/mobilization nuclease domain-containing protein n=1 Tax=uncultured Pontibacter sp. TaxID=453356 RepID=UPI002622975B|nr:relaxase/mobilization nuclease domain-containing protein [uncultured Pontibacter sp.]
MIGKVMTGKSFSGCVRYVVLKSEATVLDSDGIRTDTVASMVADFNLQRKLNPELEKAVGHIALNWSVQDKAKLSPQAMAQRAREYMEKMQIQNTQYLIVLHRDREHPHVHIVYNRVSYEGKTITDKFQRRRNAKVCRELTERHGYYLAPGKGQVNRHRLKGADKAKYELHDAIRQVLSKVNTWQELESLLRGKGISIDYKYKRGTEQVQGISFRLGELSFKGSSIDRSLSYGAISKQLEQHRQQAQLMPFGSKQHSTHGQTGSSFSCTSNGRELIPDPREGLLSPTTGQTADANDHHFKKKKRRKKKRIRL